MTPTGPHPPIPIPWGDGDPLPLVLPATWPGAHVVRPDLSGALDDYPDALGRALDAPEGSERLETMVGPGSTVAIVVDDPSRWTPVAEALPIILKRLHDAGVRREDVTVSVGGGRHHAVSDEAMRPRGGGEGGDPARRFHPPGGHPFPH